MCIKLTVLALIVFCFQVQGLQLINKNVTLNLTPDGSKIKLILSSGNNEKISAVIGENQNISLPQNCGKSSKCVLEGSSVTLIINNIDSGFEIIWYSNKTETVFQDCIKLNGDEISWFGGPERFTAQWPVEKMRISLRPYRVSKSENGAVAERYWLNSKGAYIFIDDKVPLFWDQNNLQRDSICFIAKIEEPFIQRSQVLLKYVLVAKPDPKQGQLHAVTNYLGKPTGYPNEKIIRYPIWTSWAKYKRNISDDTIQSFAKDITEQGFTGQLEIDDFWETCYGSLTFNGNRFPKINSTIKALQDVGFTVTLWVHPFVNDDCEETTRIGRQNNYFIKSTNGSDITSWWNGQKAHHIDFTKTEAQKWFKSRLKLLQDKHGIDSFKFDAGESDWPPEVPVLQGDIESSPNHLTSSYVRTCAAFGDLIEVRSAWRSQDLPVFVRMLDKDSRWGLDNGLHNLITTLLLMNIAGYTLVLPDMIGGNGYGNDVLTPELLARWIEANTFMPSMQFSYLPWEITSDRFDTLEIARTFVALHEEYTDEILKAINASINYGIPVNPPIWWVDPTNEQAFKVNDEYLLGESILVAPVVTQGAVSRDVILPVGLWKDGNNGTIYKGPKTLKNYPAPIDVLPFFIKQ